MKQRVITGAILLAVVIPLIVIGGLPFKILGIAATVIATYEMMNMFFHGKDRNVPMIVSIIIITTMIVFTSTLQNTGTWLLIGVIGLIASWLYNKRVYTPKVVAFSIFTILYIGFTFRSLLEIRNANLNLFILLIVTVILADSAAYFSGRAFGKHKLAPKISPNKTIEGAIGGWVVSGAFAFFFGQWTGLFSHVSYLVVLAILLPILSILGDLLASLLKRKYGIKDYGNLFPGHGGVMDRVDSQLLAALLLYIIIEMGGLI